MYLQLKDFFTGVRTILAGSLPDRENSGPWLNCKFADIEPNFSANGATVNEGLYTVNGFGWRAFYPILYNPRNFYFRFKTGNFSLYGPDLTDASDFRAHLFCRPGIGQDIYIPGITFTMSPDVDGKVRLSLFSASPEYVNVVATNVLAAPVDNNSIVVQIRVVDRSIKVYLNSVLAINKNTVAIAPENLGVVFESTGFKENRPFSFAEIGVYDPTPIIPDNPSENITTRTAANFKLPVSPFGF